ncbi:MAG TPA: MarR family transcriptional regulator [Actinocrinis sp.]|nr:MarR family transcriptional regulator [Actinocrinis sp.]
MGDRRVEDADRGEPRWLDERERAAWLGAVALMLKVPAALDAQLTKSAELTMFEYLLLARLSEQPDRRVRMSTPAVLTNGSLSRLSHVADRLEKRGLLCRHRDPQNVRYLMAVLTTEGYDLVVKAAPGHVEAVRELVIDALSADQLLALKDLGAHVLARLDPETSWPP